MSSITRVQTDRRADDTVPPLDLRQDDIQVYDRRWYLLALYAILGFLQLVTWNTFGPILDSSQLVFGWSVAEVAWIANIEKIGTLICLPCTLLFVYKKDLRVSTLIAAGLNCVGSLARCVTSNSILLFVMCLLCGLFNGISRTITLVCPSLLSTVWFPINQKATTTVILFLSQSAGFSLSFIIGPLIVHYNKPTGNHTIDTEDVQEQRNEIMLLIYIEAALNGALFLLTVIYFPAKPPKPPSLFASIERLDYVDGIKHLCKKIPVWFIVIAYALTATFYSWGNIWNVTLTPLGLTQIEAGWLGFCITGAGVTSGFFISLLTDRFPTWMKVLLVTLLVCASVSITFAALFCLRIIQTGVKVGVCITMILSGMTIFGALPLFYKISSENAYPVEEGIIGISLTVFHTAVCIIFLIIVINPEAGIWCILVCTILTVPLVLLAKITYGRVNVEILTSTPTINYGSREPSQRSVDINMSDKTPLTYKDHNRLK